VSEDRRQAIVGFYRSLNRPAPGPSRLRLGGLDPDLEYRIAIWPSSDGATASVTTATARRGDELHAIGLPIDSDRDEAAGRGDFWARLFVLEAV